MLTKVDDPNLIWSTPRQGSRNGRPWSPAWPMIDADFVFAGMGSCWRSVPRAHGRMDPTQHAAAAANPTGGAMSSGFGGRVFVGCLERNGHNGRCDGFGSRVHRWLRLLDITDLGVWHYWGLSAVGGSKTINTKRADRRFVSLIGDGDVSGAIY